MLKKQLQKGFTIVELLIVIVIIGILALLVLNTFNGVQQKARDTERQTDATSISKQLEAYYADNGAGSGGGYPQFSQLGTTPAQASAFLKGTAENAYTAPGRPTGTWSWQNSAATNKDQYGYQAFVGPSSAPGAACAANDACQSFVITYWKENGGLQTIKSLN